MYLQYKAHGQVNLTILDFFLNLCFFFKCCNTHSHHLQPINRLQSFQMYKGQRGEGESCSNVVDGFCSTNIQYNFVTLLRASFLIVILRSNLGVECSWHLYNHRLSGPSRWQPSMLGTNWEREESWSYCFSGFDTGCSPSKQDSWGSIKAKVSENETLSKGFGRVKRDDNDTQWKRAS